MKKLIITTFAIAFVLALALPASAQSVCGSAGTQGMPSCSAVKAGTSCCVPPAAQVSSKTIKSGGKGAAVMATQHQQEVQSQQVLPAVKGPSNKPSVAVSAPAAPAAPAAMATGPTNGGTGPGTGIGSITTPTTPAVTAPATNAPVATAPATSSKGSIQRGASSSGGRGGSAGASAAFSAGRR